MMNEVKLPFGMRVSDGRIVSVDTVIRGLECGCICPECKVPLIAAKGDVNVHHFRHQAEDGLCGGGRETALHKFAKQIICDELRLALPGNFDCGTMNSAEQEVWLDGLRPDVLAKYDSEPVAIEVYVQHRVPRDKIESLHDRQLCTVEIDLHLHWDAVNPSEDRLRDEVLFRAPRRWIYEPIAIREKRAADLKAMREAEKLAAIAAAKRAEEEAEAKRIEEELQEEIARVAALEAEERAKVIRLEQLETAEQNKIREQERQLERKRQKVEQKLRNDAWQRDQAERRAAIAAEEAKQAHKRWLEREAQAKHEALRIARLEQIKAERQPPDLQALVLAHGTYDKIPEDAWQRFHRDMASWKARIRHGDAYWEMAQLKIAG
jgi:hypothetical protein